MFDLIGSEGVDAAGGAFEARLHRRELVEHLAPDDAATSGASRHRSRRQGVQHQPLLMIRFLLGRLKILGWDGNAIKE